MVTVTGKPGALHVPRKGNKAFGQGPARIIIDKNQLLEEELEGTVRTTPESDNSSNGSNTSSLNSQEEDDNDNVQELKGGGGNKNKKGTVTSHKLGSLVNRFNGSSPPAAGATSASKRAPVKTFKQQQEEAAAAAAAAALAIPRSSLKGCTSNVVMCTDTVQKKPELQGILRDYYYNENNVLVHKDPPKIKTPLEQRVKPSKRSKGGANAAGMAGGRMLGVKLRRGKRPDRKPGDASDDEDGDNYDLGCESDEGSFDGDYGGPVGAASPRSVIASNSSSSKSSAASAEFTKPRLVHRDSFTGESAFAATASDSGSDSDGNDVIGRGSSGSDGSNEAKDMGGGSSKHSSMSRAQKLQNMRRASSNSLCSASDSSDSECPYRSSYGCGNAVLTIDSPSCAKLKLSAAALNAGAGGSPSKMTTPDLQDGDENDDDANDDSDAEFASSKGSKGSKSKKKVRQRSAASASARLMSPRRKTAKDGASDNDSTSSSEANKKKPAAMSPRQHRAIAKSQQQHHQQQLQLQQQHQGSSNNKDDPVWKFDLSALEKTAESSSAVAAKPLPQVLGRKESIRISSSHERIQPATAAAKSNSAAATAGAGIAQASIDLRSAERAARLAKAKERIEREALEKQRVEDEIKAEKKRLEEEAAKKGTSEEDRRDLAYQWYTRCGMPSRTNLKMRISQIKSCEITESDVDLLPWMAGGSMVNVGAMMKLQKTTG